MTQRPTMDDSRKDSVSRNLEMPVERYRSIEDMPPPWKDPDDPDNLRRVAEMMTFHRRMMPPEPPGVSRFQTIEEVNASRKDPYRHMESKP